MEWLASLDAVGYTATREHLAVNAGERKGQAVDHIGVDVRKRDRQIYIRAEGSGVIEAHLAS